MSFSPEWDARYKEKVQMCKWPFSDLVSYVMRYVHPGGSDFNVLELGCGSGANIPFFLSLGVNYYGLDGSMTIVEYLKQKFPQISGNIKCVDFTQEIPFLEEFDLIVDRASVTHNSTKAIQRCLSIVHGKMKDHAKFVGIDWFSSRHSEYAKGMPADDGRTRSGYTEGVFGGLGKIHFSDKSHLMKLFEHFEFIILEHKMLRQVIPSKCLVQAWWDFIVEKR